MSPRLAVNLSFMMASTVFIRFSFDKWNIEKAGQELYWKHTLCFVLCLSVNREKVDKYIINFEKEHMLQKAMWEFFLS